MKGSFIAFAVVGVLGMNYYLVNKCDNVEYYNNHSVSYEEKIDKFEDNNQIILLVDNASETDVLLAEKRSKTENAPIYRVSSSDELPQDVLEQDRRAMYVYGQLDSFVEAMLKEDGFFNADSWQ